MTAVEKSSHKLRAPDLDVNAYMLELTLKRNYPDKDPQVPDFPIFSIHSLNPGNYKGAPSKLVQICDMTPYPRLPKGSISKEDMADMIKYWPALEKGFPFYLNWSYQAHKHGSKALFLQDFIKTTLYLGKRFIKSIQDFMILYGYGRAGMHNCQQFQEHIREDLGFKVGVIYGWDKMDENEKREPPALVKLLTIQILFDENLKTIDYERNQPSLKDLRNHHFYLPDIVGGELE
ncbi:hypothetical protein OROHE_003574 [Orobanche hederae]